LAETDCEKDLNGKRKLDANLGIFHASVNSDRELSWQFSTFSTQNWQCHPEDEMCPW
jgi:hypothetical protein